MTDVHEVLAVQEVANGTFIAPFTYDRGRVMDGGQLAAQALNAALQTVSASFDAHSIHGSFLAAGDALKPVELHIVRDRDGRSFCQRHVTAYQDDRLLFRMSASFQVPEAGVDMQLLSMPSVTSAADSAGFEPGLIGFEARDPAMNGGRRRQAWVRPAALLGPDPRWNACALLYVSDMFNALPDGLVEDESGFQTSLDHAVWFHRPVRLDDWVLMTLESTTLASGRGWFKGEYFSAAGVHVATSAQEMVYRPARPH